LKIVTARAVSVLLQLFPLPFQKNKKISGVSCQLNSLLFLREYKSLFFIKHQNTAKSHTGSFQKVHPLFSTFQEYRHSHLLFLSTTLTQNVTNTPHHSSPRSPLKAPHFHSHQNHTSPLHIQAPSPITPNKRPSFNSRSRACCSVEARVPYLFGNHETFTRIQPCG